MFCIPQVWVRKGFPIFIIFSAKYWWITVICVVLVLLVCGISCCVKVWANRERVCQNEGSNNQQRIELHDLNRIEPDNVQQGHIYRNRLVLDGTQISKNELN